MKKKGQRATATDLFDNRGLKVGDWVLLGGTYASYPGQWYSGRLAWVGKEEILVERWTQNGQPYVQLETIYAVRAVGETVELLKIQDLARKSVKELTDRIHEAEAELGRARDALHARLEELQKGGLKIEAFDRAANDACDAALRATGEALDAEQLASESA